MSRLINTIHKFPIKKLTPCYGIFLHKSSNVSKISTTSIQHVNQRWRKEQRLEMNPNKYGPLTNLPDFTYLDGRPTPLGSRQFKRFVKQKEIASKIVEGIREIDFAVKRNIELKEQQQKYRQQILDRKLKPKGHLLLNKGTK